MTSDVILLDLIARELHRLGGLCCQQRDALAMAARVPILGVDCRCESADGPEEKCALLAEARNILMKDAEQSGGSVQQLRLAAAQFEIGSAFISGDDAGNQPAGVRDRDRHQIGAGAPGEGIILRPQNLRTFANGQAVNQFPGMFLEFGRRAGGCPERNSRCDSSRTDVPFG